MISYLLRKIAESPGDIFEDGKMFCETLLLKNTLSFQELSQNFHNMTYGTMFIHLLYDNTCMYS